MIGQKFEEIWEFILLPSSICRRWARRKNSNVALWAQPKTPSTMSPKSKITNFAISQGSNSQTWISLKYFFIFMILLMRVKMKQCLWHPYRWKFFFCRRASLEWVVCITQWLQVGRRGNNRCRSRLGCRWSERRVLGNVPVWFHPWLCPLPEIFAKTKKVNSILSWNLVLAVQSYLLI